MPDGAAQVEQHKAAQRNVAGQQAALLDDAAFAQRNALRRIQGYLRMHQRRKRQLGRGQPGHDVGPARGAAHGHGHGQRLDGGVEVGGGAQVGEARHGRGSRGAVVIKAPHVPG